MSTLTAREWKAALALTLTSWAVLSSACLAQPDREVIVMFRPGVVNLPAGVDSGSVEQARLGSESTYSILSEYGVERIRKGMPGFHPSFFMNAYGDTVWRTDFSRVYALRLPAGADRDAIIADLYANPDVVYAEPNGTCVVFGAPYPADPDLKEGSQWGIWRSVDSPPDSGLDVDVPEAWLKTTRKLAAPRNRVLIIDEGFDGSHPDLAGRVGFEADSGVGDHAFMVAGIIGATTDNGLGISGIDWRAWLDSKYGPTFYDVPALAQAIEQAQVFTTTKVINMSWGLFPDDKSTTPLNALTVKAALADFYMWDGAIGVAAVGNSNRDIIEYPAGFDYPVRSGPVILAVGATDRGNARWQDPFGYGGSNWGPHLDVVAPGADIRSLTYSSYGFGSGTSFAAPIASGIASLLYALDDSLIADDVEKLIQLSADDLGTPGKDTSYGYGRVNARRALALRLPPNQYQHGLTPQGAGALFDSIGPIMFRRVTSEDTLSPHGYKRYQVRVPVHFPDAFPDAQHLHVWGRGQLTLCGEPPDTFIYDTHWCESIPGSITAEGCTLRTYIRRSIVPAYWLPCYGDGAYPVQCAWSALWIAPQLDPGYSYFTPESGPLTSPNHGNEAVKSFRACPNNDGGSSLPLNARLRVVVRDSTGQPIPSISASDIYVLLNRGTSAQGFYGDGADSVIANSTWNQAPLCPDLNVITADAPTTSAGVTFITLAGATPEYPGVAVRDPSRKWGHYDTDLPVYVLGQQLSGKIDSTAANGSYVLRIKNFDLIGGVGALMNVGEMVTFSDYQSIAAGGSQPGNPLNYWRDLNSDGNLDFEDTAIEAAHYFHDCEHPHNP